MGDGQKGVLRVDFDRRVKLTFLGSKVTTDAGLLAYRELDEVLGLTDTASDSLCDSRVGSNKQHRLTALFRQSIYSRLAGYEDVNDAERLRIDPAMRHVVGGRASQPEKQAASMSEVGRFETEMLSERRNLTALMDLSGEWIDGVHLRKPLKKLILDMDSSVSETYGPQEGQPTTDTSSACAITRYFCSIKMATWNERCSGAAITLVQSSGGGCWCRWLHATVTWTSPSCFGAMRPLPIRHCTFCWRKKDIAT
jgi:hypothetical protein